jgi:hypothetical protein
MLTIMGLLVLLPFQMWAERSRSFQRLSPLEQNLQRASHGAAVIVLVLIAVFFTFGIAGVLLFVPHLVTNFADTWPGLLVLVPLAYAIPRLVAGVRRCQGARDGLLATRAAVKFLLGLVALPVLWSNTVARVAAPDFWLACGWLLLNAVAVWLIVTGAVRFALLMWPRRAAYTMVADSIAANEFQWDGPQPRRRWWQFWKRWKR